jgi:hypothetical protein
VNTVILLIINGTCFVFICIVMPTINKPSIHFLVYNVNQIVVWMFIWVVSLKENRSDLFGSGWLVLDLGTSQIQVQCSTAELQMKMKANMQEIIMMSGNKTK